MEKTISRLKRAVFPITCGIPPISVNDIIADSDSISLTFKEWNLDRRAGNFIDLAAVVAILAFKKPKRVFEFGTGFGRTSYQFSLNTPEDCVIYTLDLTTHEKGFIFKDKPEAKKINQLVGDSRQMDLSRFSKSMDFIFIDGGHDYETVMADTLKAFEMIGQGGFILWDDFSPDWPGVVKALNDLKAQNQIYRVVGTSIAFCRF